jgi:hypothetical protein
MPAAVVKLAVSAFLELIPRGRGAEFLILWNGKPDGTGSRNFLRIVLTEARSLPDLLGSAFRFSLRLSCGGTLRPFGDGASPYE